MLIELFKPISSQVKLKQVSIDNNVFKLHYKFTMVLLVSCSLLVTASQLFGKPIECIEPKETYTKDLLNTFCWIQSTFTLPDSLQKKVGVEVVAPGIDKYTEGEDRIYHRYYQWVWIVLFLQGISFYLTRFLWKLWEGGRLKSLVIELNKPVLKDEKRKDQIKLLVSYLKENFTHHNLYFIYFIICEVINFINVVIQIFIADKFLGGAFANYGFEVLSYSEMEMENRTDPMIVIFPRMTKCTFFHYGPSGDVQRHDHLCLLPLNIVNEKIYIMVWFWFMILSLISGLVLVYRMIMLTFPPIRKLILRKRASTTPRHQIDLVLDFAQVGDWWLLYLLSKNIDAYHFREVISEFNKQLNGGSDGGVGSELIEQKDYEDTEKLKPKQQKLDEDTL